MTAMRSDGKQKVVVIAGPVGVGKNTIINEVIRRCPSCVDLVTSTTRKPRPGEKQGVDYFFMTEEEFDAHAAKGDILEVSHHPAGFRKGTFAPYINEHLAKGDTVIGDLTLDGAKFLKEHFGALCIFIEPPHFSVLEKRIRARHDNMSQEELEKRLELAKKELEEAPWYDYRVMNEEGKLDEAVDNVIHILRKEGYIE